MEIWKLFKNNELAVPQSSVQLTPVETSGSKASTLGQSMSDFFDTMGNIIKAKKENEAKKKLENARKTKFTLPESLKPIGVPKDIVPSGSTNTGVSLASRRRPAPVMDEEEPPPAIKPSQESVQQNSQSFFRDMEDMYNLKRPK